MLIIYSFSTKHSSPSIHPKTSLMKYTESPPKKLTQTQTNFKYQPKKEKYLTSHEFPISTRNDTKSQFKWISFETDTKLNKNSKVGKELSYQDFLLDNERDINTRSDNIKISKQKQKCTFYLN
jgi:hypothetical protein